MERLLSASKAGSVEEPVRLQQRYEQMRHAARDLLFGRTFISGADRQEVALTFDDGPNEPYTSQLLDLLARYEVHATFFLIGNYVRRQPATVRAIRQAGHLLGNHTMTHPSLRWQWPRRVRKELADCNAAIEDATGEAVYWFRPPFGGRRPDVLHTAAELGLTPVMWNVWAHDWDATHSQNVAALVQEGIQHNQGRHRGSNVLLHDGGHQQLGTDRTTTVEATANLLKAWTGSGLRLVTLDAWRRPHPAVS
jgi:peptidoglycan-N-acetylglucosamine deacetylase